MNAPTVSVIVVSHGRPDALAVCLTGLEQLLYPTFEVVVVADKAGIARLTENGWETRVKLVPFETQNISQARNLGIAAAAGEIVAFIDDDAVPEPTWLGHLIPPFEQEGVVAAGGFVRARNGISFQWKARDVRRDGVAQSIEVDPEQCTILTPTPSRAIKTEGTNMAFRRDVLLGMGGFDPAFKFYLDETDLNMRIAQSGGRTAVVPLAQVHHGFAKSVRRREDRAPTTLFEVGASQTVFLRKYASPKEAGPAWRAFESARRRSLVRYMVRGLIEPRDVWTLMRGLKAGRSDGLARPLGPLPDLVPTGAAFLNLERSGASGVHRVLSGVRSEAESLADQARQGVRAGDIVSVLRFSRSALFHRQRFHEDGYWIQTGGIWGRSERSDPLFRLWRRRARIERETARVSRLRGENKAP